MKDLISNKKNDIENKITLLSNPDTLTYFENGVVIGFIHPISGNIIYLANAANITDICYSKNPKLLGTLSIKHAKVYPDIDAAKKDIYLLRYHHRDFLKITTIAKSVMHFHAELMLPDPQGCLYELPELIAEPSC